MGWAVLGSVLWSRVWAVDGHATVMGAGLRAITSRGPYKRNVAWGHSPEGLWNGRAD